jgi:alpha-D-ribose 1-methylphosphonate 5-triphosphate synthase subunit PhnH
MMGNVLQDQRMFRVLLQAMAHPGRVYQAPFSGNRSEVLISVLEALLDQEVSCCVLSPEREIYEQKIHAVTHCKSTGPGEADFIVVPSGNSGGGILEAKRGTLEYPDQGATAVYGVDSLNTTGNGTPQFALLGPGIKNRICIVMKGFPCDELLRIRQLNAEFPLGVDCIFIDRAGNLLCIPRSVQIQVSTYGLCGR